jgi:ABC-type lipoprotein export system ATPase subunit
VLNIENLSSGYGRSDVIRGIDIEVPKGHLVCIIGGNGAGKSTTMRTVSGMMNATSGRVCLGGRDITNMPSHRIASLGLAHVPEGRRVFVSMSVFDNLRLGAYRRTDRRAVIRDLDGVMETFPRLAERRGQLAGTLSGGEQQMLAIGRALMAAPEMLLLRTFARPCAKAGRGGLRHDRRPSEAGAYHAHSRAIREYCVECGRCWIRTRKRQNRVVRQWQRASQQPSCPSCLCRRVQQTCFVAVHLRDGQSGSTAQLA